MNLSSIDLSRRRYRSRTRKKSLPDRRLTEEEYDRYVWWTIRNSAETLCYDPGDREIKPAGEWVFILRNVPVQYPPKPGSGYWAHPWPDGKDGWRKGRYSVCISLPDGPQIRLWPYEYAILPFESIEDGMQRGELIFHPSYESLNLSEMPEIGDLVGALMLDGLTTSEALYELTAAGLAKDVRVPPPGWFEATFELPWAD